MGGSSSKLCDGCNGVLNPTKRHHCRTCNAFICHQCSVKVSGKWRCRDQACFNLVPLSRHSDGDMRPASSALVFAGVSEPSGSVVTDQFDVQVTAVPKKNPWAQPGFFPRSSGSRTLEEQLASQKTRAPTRTRTRSFPGSSSPCTTSSLHHFSLDMQAHARPAGAVESTHSTKRPHVPTSLLPPCQSLSDLDEEEDLDLAVALSQQDPSDPVNVTELAQAITLSKRGHLKVPELTQRSREFLANVSGFLDSKSTFDTTAMRVLPHKWMEIHTSFTDAVRLLQKNSQGGAIRTPEELYEVATVAKPVFDNLMQQLVRSSGLEPEDIVKIDGQTVMLDPKTPFRVLTLAPLKSKPRCAEKAMNEYKGDYSRLIDVVRCSVVVFTEEQLECVAKALSPGNTSGSYRVVRLKNRFKTPLFNGYRDALYSIEISCGSGISHVCEVQLHLASLVAHKETSHVFYEYFRAYFTGSGAEEQRMVALVKLGARDRDPDRMIADVVRGSDIKQLEALRELVGLMGDPNLSLLVSKRLVALTGSREAKFLHLVALKRNGNASEVSALSRELLLEGATPECRRTVEKVLGDDHEREIVAQEFVASQVNALTAKPNKNDDEKMLLVMLLEGETRLNEAEVLAREMLATERSPLYLGMLARLMIRREEWKEAEALYREALSMSRQQEGKNHVNTVSLMSKLAVTLEANEKFADAELLHRESLALRRNHFGDLAPKTLKSLQDLGWVLTKQGKFKEAELVYQEALSGRRRVFGNSSKQTLSTAREVSTFFEMQNRFQEAEALARECYLGRKQLLGEYHEETLRISAQLGFILFQQNMFAEALEVYQQVVVAAHTCRPNTAQDIHHLGFLLGQVEHGPYGRA